jgi:hypothetical protein
MNGSVLLLSLLLAYAGMLSFCLCMERHWKQLVGTRLPASVRSLGKPLGALLLVLALYAASGAWLGGMALVGWFGLVSLAGLALLLLLPYAPRLVLWLPVFGALLWGVALVA